MRIFANPNYNFIKWRWHALVGSIVLIWIGVFSIYQRGGIPKGIDFTGGTQLTIKFHQPTDQGAVRRALDPLSKDIVVQQYGPASDNAILVRLPLGATTVENLEADEARVKQALEAAKLASFADKRDEVSSDIVGPVIGKDLQNKGIMTTLAALGGMLVYIGIRFRFTFGIGAIIATFHDILITLVVLSWAGYELSLNVIAAILTITGYSVNDTIVVFDRVRENQRLMRKEPLDQIVNKSVNQTLGRTIITSGTTFLAVLALYLWGGEVLRGFAFTMLIGILTGTYSTVFIAATIAIILSRWQPKAPTQAQAQAAGKMQAKAPARRR